MDENIVTQFTDLFLSILRDFEKCEQRLLSSKNSKDELLASYIMKKLSRIMIHEIMLGNKLLGSFIICWQGIIKKYRVYDGFMTAILSEGDDHDVFYLPTHIGQSFHILCENTINNDNRQYVGDYTSQVFDYSGIREQILAVYKSNFDRFK
jgi:hypothetical protein